MGQYFDAESSLHYNYFRHYDPDAGRYVSPDPLGLEPADNPVAYVCNPFAQVDPFGLAPYLREGYKPSPFNPDDPYSPESRDRRSAENREHYRPSNKDRAAELGYKTRIPAQKAPFHSHGQEVFSNGKNYITPDVDGHNVSDGWKMFNRRGQRIGTYDQDLNYLKE
jgi:RHS repeat-associated protein